MKKMLVEIRSITELEDSRKEVTLVFKPETEYEKEVIEKIIPVYDPALYSVRSYAETNLQQPITQKPANFKASS